MSKIRTVLAILACAALVGCAVGTNFTRPDAGKLVLGKSTTADITALMGEPRRVGEGLKNDQRIKTLQYSYATTGGEGLYEGVVPGRGMGFVTHNDLLVAQEYVSSFKEDGTDFDDAKIGSIVKGKTTRAEVMSMFGKGSGEAIYPIVKNKGEKALLYTYGQARRDGLAMLPKVYRKTLIVSFTPQDIVSDVDYSSTGEK